MEKRDEDLDPDRIGCGFCRPGVRRRQCNVPTDQWQPREALQKKLESEGWKVRSIKTEHGCYEAKALDANGKRLEAVFDPKTLDRSVPIPTTADHHERHRFDPRTSVKVWSPYIRLFHWSLVLCVAVAWLSSGEIMKVHELAGYCAGGLIASRLIAGLVGSIYALPSIRA